MPRENRFVEKLANADVTMADIIGDVDPSAPRAAAAIFPTSSPSTTGLLPRANRGIFRHQRAPRSRRKIQVGLFNIMQEATSKLRAILLRLPLDVLLVFNRQSRGLHAAAKSSPRSKDRIGAEIRTHYPASIEESMTITAQEAWVARDSGKKIEVPQYLRQVVEEIAFQAREDKRVDRRSGVSQRLPITTMERSSSVAPSIAPPAPAKKSVVARVADVYAALPSITGKMELEYEGELKGSDTIARELIRTAVGRVFSKHFTALTSNPSSNGSNWVANSNCPSSQTQNDRFQQLSKIPRRHGAHRQPRRPGSQRHRRRSSSCRK